jgi:hypothetical protein
MKYLVLLSFLLTSTFVNAQGKLVFMYADASANTSNQALTTKLYDALQETDSRLLVYISNGVNPVVSTSIYDMQNVVNTLSKLKPPLPNVAFDVDSINRIFNAESSFDFSNLNSSKNNADDLFFFFFFDVNTCRLNKQIEKIAERLLLSNRLISKNGLNANCKIRIYFNNVQSEIDKNYIRYIKEVKGYEVVEY